MHYLQYLEMQWNLNKGFYVVITSLFVYTFVQHQRDSQYGFDGSALLGMAEDVPQSDHRDARGNCYTHHGHHQAH